MLDTDTGNYFLALSGGGMDLTQDIALTYYIIEKWIPYELCEAVCETQLSVNAADWIILKLAMVESLKLYAERAQDKLKRWKDG
jgi:hypothetical protein